MEATVKKEFKTDFKKWYRKSYDYDNFWNSVPKSMQWGVYVDFFDSVGLNISINCGLITKTFSYKIHDFQVHDIGSEIKTRSEAREKALEKAIEIYQN